MKGGMHKHKQLSPLSSFSPSARFAIAWNYMYHKKQPATKAARKSLINPAHEEPPVYQEQLRVEWDWYEAEILSS